MRTNSFINTLADGSCIRLRPEHRNHVWSYDFVEDRTDNGPEFVAKAVREWIAAVGAKTAYIERGSPWENGYIESFNARLRDELLNGENFYTLREAQIVIESWRRHYNTIRPHASIGYKPPAPEVFVPAFAAWPAALRRPVPPATLAQRPTLN
jgi:putative transposase